MVTDNFTVEWFQEHGSLLPTNAGHNCGLNDDEMRVLNDFIVRSVSTPLKEEEEKEMKRI